MRFCCRRPEKRARVAAASPRIADDCEEAVELRENREEWMDALQGRLKTCCCAITGCLEFRRRYRDGAVTLRYSLANYPEERLRRHLVCLGHSAQGIDGIVERVKQNKDVRVALWHYFTDDREGTTLIAVTTDQLHSSESDGESELEDVSESEEELGPGEELGSDENL